MKPKAFLAIFLSLIFIFAKAAGDNLVICHYLLRKQRVQDDPEVLKQQIQLAQSKGIDAFALNAQEWHPELADAIFKAAEDLGSGFKLFFSADMNDGGTLTPDQIVAMLNYSSPSLLKHNGKQMFQAWVGDKNSRWEKYNYSSSLAAWHDIFQKAGGKDKFFFVPFFSTDGSYPGVQGKLKDFGEVIDGIHAWDVSAWPYNASDGYQSPDFSLDQNYLKACNEKSKAYMPSVSPWFFKSKPGDCEVKGNFQGPGLWLTKWNELIKLNTYFLQIVTWNDWVETHYVGPTLSNGASEAAEAGVYYLEGFPHVAFLELGEHYIRWYKSGNEPDVTEDSLYMFYYTHSKTLNVPSDGCPDGVQRASSLEDKLYVTAMVTGPATLELSSGDASQTFTITAKGISTLSMDFQQGHQAAVLKRGDVVVSTLNGNQTISNSNVSESNFNVYSTCTKC